MSILKVLGGIAALIVWGILLSQCFNLINAPDDMQVIVGGVGVLVLLGGLAYAAQKLWSTYSKLFITAILLISVPTLTGCFTVVDPGHAGVKVNRYGSNRGVDDYPVQTGQVWYNPFTSDVIQYPTYMQTAQWSRNPNEGSTNNEEIAFNSKEGLSITADISLSYQLRQDKVPHFYVKFRADNINTFTHGFLRNVARDAFTEEAAHYTAEELYGLKKEEFLTHVRARVNAQIDTLGVSVEQLGFIGLLRLPENVVQALNAKVKAIQDASTAENNLRTATANAAIRVATAEGEARARVAAAEGEARANRVLIPQLTANAIEWRRLNLQELAIAKWKGEVPTTMMGGTGVPFVNLPNPR